MSLIDCLKAREKDIPEYERNSIVAEVNSLIDMGMTEQKAARKVIREKIKELKTERKDIEKVIRTELAERVEKVEVGKPIPEAKEPWEMGREEYGVSFIDRIQEITKRTEELAKSYAAMGAELVDPKQMDKTAKQIERLETEKEKYTSPQWIERTHKQAVQQAIKQGKITSHPDYPELGKVEIKAEKLKKFKPFIPRELESLAKKARDYKNPREFWNSLSQKEQNKIFDKFKKPYLEFWEDAQKVKPKQPHEMLQVEYIKEAAPKNIEEAKRQHRIKVSGAVVKGLPVSKDVLEDYRGVKWADEALKKVEKPTPPEPKVEKEKPTFISEETRAKARDTETKARQKRLKFAAGQKYLVPWIAASGGVWEIELKGEIDDAIYTQDARGRKKLRKGVMLGFKSRKTGRTLDVVVRDAREAGFDVKDTDHLIELIEKDLSAAEINDIKGRVGKLTTEPTTQDEFIEGLIENGREELRREGLADQEVERTLEEGREDAEAIPVDTREEEYARLEREAIEEEERLTPEELEEAKKKPVQETLIKKEAPFELKGEEPPPKVVGPLGKKAVIPTEKIPTATKGEQVSLLPKEKGEQIGIEEAIEEKGKPQTIEVEGAKIIRGIDTRGEVYYEVEGSWENLKKYGFDPTTFTIDTTKVEKLFTETRLAMEPALAAEPRGYEFTKQQQKDLIKIGQLIFQWLKRAGADAEVLKNITLELKPFLDLRGVSPTLMEKTLADWGKEGGMKVPVAATTINNLHATVQLAINGQNLANLERLTYHEWYHIAKRWMLPQSDIGALRRHFKTEEGEADAFAEYMKSAKTIAKEPSLIKRLFLKLKRMLNIIANGLKGKGFTRPEDIFGAIRVGAYKPIRMAAKGGPSVSLLAEPEPVPPFYSQLITAVEKAPDMPKKVVSLKNWLAKKAKPEELKWMDVDRWIAQNTKPDKTIDKAAFLEFLRGNEIEVREVARGEYTDLLAEIQDEGLMSTANSIEESLDLAGLDDVKSASLLNRWVDSGASDTEAETQLDALLDKTDETRSVSEIYDAQIEGLKKMQPEATKYDQYTLPGAEAYRELLLTLPVQEMSTERRRLERLQIKDPAILTEAERKELDELVALDDAGKLLQPKRTYPSPHWEEPNVLAHVRFNERTDAQGNKVLFVEEIQSDWLQEAKKKGFKTEVTKDFRDRIEKITRVLAGFRLPTGEGTALSGDGLVDWFRHLEERLAIHPNNQLIKDYLIDKVGESFFNETKGLAEQQESDQPLYGGVPPAPFLKTWHEFVMKRMLRYAAEHGFDNLAWTTGVQQSERYDLAKHIDKIQYIKNPSGTYNLAAMKGGSEITGLTRELTDISLDKIEELAGKNVARKIRDGDNEGEISGLDLKMGGEGMVAFYDRLLLGFMDKYVKQWGAKVGKAEIDVGKKPRIFDITQGPAGRWYVYTPGIQDGDTGWFESEAYETEEEALDLLDVLRGEESGKERLESVHSVPITQEMHKAVMFKGQTFFAMRKLTAEEQEWADNWIKNALNETSKEELKTKKIDQIKTANAVEKTVMDGEAIKKAYSENTVDTLFNNYTEKDGTLNTDKLEEHTGIEEFKGNANAPLDLKKGIRYLQTMQDMERSFPSMAKIFAVENRRSANNHHANIRDYEITRDYYDLKRNQWNKINRALSHGDRIGRYISNEDLEKKFGLNQDERKGYWAMRKILDVKLQRIISNKISELLGKERRDLIDIDSTIKAIYSRNNGLSRKGASEGDLTNKLIDKLKRLHLKGSEIELIAGKGGIANWAFARRAYVPHDWDSHWRAWAIDKNDTKHMFELPDWKIRIHPTQEGRIKAAEGIAKRVVDEKLGKDLKMVEGKPSWKVVYSRDIPVELSDDASLSSIKSIMESAIGELEKEYDTLLPLEKQEELKSIKEKIQKHAEELYLAKGWGKHLIPRRDVQGYRDDLHNVIAEYLYGFNAYENKGIAAREFAEAMRDVNPKDTPEQWKAAKEYVSDMLGEMHEAAWFKKVAGFYFLAGDVSAAALNMTQNWTHAVGLLRKIPGKGITAEREIATAMYDVGNEYISAKKEKRPLYRKESKHISKEEVDALRVAYEKGWLDPQYFGEVTGMQQRKVYQSYLQKAHRMAYILFTGSEGMNRMSTFLAGYRRAKRAGMDIDVATRKAADAVKGAHFIYGRGNRPEIIRKAGPIGSIAYTYMTYPVNNLVFLKHRFLDLHQAQTKEEKQTALKVLGSNLAYIFLFGGLNALPFAFLAKFIWKLFSDPEDDWEKLIYEKAPKPVARTITRGIPAVFGNDMSWRVEGTDILGAPIGFQTARTIYRRAKYRAYKPIKRGEYWHTIFLGMPDMLMNPYTAFIAEGGPGIEGKPPIEYVPTEMVWKAMGFTPTRESEMRKAREISRGKREQRLDKLESFAERYIQAKKKNDNQAIKELWQEVKEHYKKEKARGREGVTITTKDVIDSARRRQKAREKGYEERLPKYMRPFQREVGETFGLQE